MKLYTLPLLCYFILSSFSVGAQSELIFVCDSTTKKPISFATIAADTSGFYSHVDGSFPRELLTEKEYRVTCVGYHPKTFITGSDRDTIFLAPSQMQLDEAVVKGEYETYEVGFHDFETAEIYFGSSSLIFATHLVSSNTRRERIEEVIIPFENLRKGDKFTVSLFSADDNGIPGELIFSKEVEYDKRDDLVRMNVANHKIDMPEKGVFIGVSEVEARNDGKLRLHKPMVQSTNKVLMSKTYWFTENRWRHYVEHRGEFWNLKVGLTLRPF